MPSSAATPPLRTIARPLSIACPEPDISSSTSTPSPPVRVMMSSTRSGCVAENVASAPTRLASSSFCGFTSTANTVEAPAARATGIAIKPIEPTPVMTTDFAETPAAITVWTALPSGSNTAAQLSGIDGSSFQTLDSGMRM